MYPIYLPVNLTYQTSRQAASPTTNTTTTTTLPHQTTAWMRVTQGDKAIPSTGTPTDPKHNQPLILTLTIPYSNLSSPG